jgi:putative transposase
VPRCIVTSVATEVVRQAYRFALDPTPAQERALQRHAGARRWAFNHAIAVYRHVSAQRAAALAIAAAADGKEASPVTVRQPSFQDVNTAFNRWKTGRSNELPDWWTSTHPDDAPDWVGENSSQVYLWAIYESREALTRFFNSTTGKQTGPRIGFPRFATKKSSPVRFKVTGGNTTGARPVDSRHIQLPIIGAIRTHEPTRKLLRRTTNGTVSIKNATVSQRAGRWHIAFSCEVAKTARVRPAPSRRQRAGNTVGVDVGVKALAALSTGEIVPNPRTANTLRTKVTRVQQAIARCQKGSHRQQALYRRLARLKHTEANRRRAHLHQLTTRLVHNHDHVVLEDLAVKAMTATARGTTVHPGKRVRQKAGLNRAILDASFGELRRQLTYKTSWYGAQLTVADRWAPTSKTCSACGWRHPNLTLADRQFHCDDCGLSLDRDLNAAHNLRQLAAADALPTGELPAAVAPTAEETQNARRADTRPPTPSGAGGSRHRREKPAPTRSVGIRRAARDTKGAASTTTRGTPTPVP